MSSLSTSEHAPPGFLLWVADQVHAHRGQLLAQARRFGLDPEDALDAVQEAFVTFLTLPASRTVDRSGDDARRLLAVLLRHQALNEARKRRRRGRHHADADFALDQAADDRSSSEDLVLRAEELARVSGCILRMEHLRRAVILLSLVDEQPHEAVAEILGISVGYVRVLLHRARQHVRTCSTEELSEDGPAPLDDALRDLLPATP